MGDTRPLPRRVCDGAKDMIKKMTTAHGLAEVKRDPLVYAVTLAAVEAGAAWLRTQGIYIFDADVVSALATTDGNQSVPAEVLKRMPAPCVWIQDDGADSGFFAWLPSGRGTMALLGAVGDWPGFNVCVELPLGMSVARGMEEVAAAAVEVNLAEGARDRVAAMVAKVLYLCSDEPDVEGYVSRRNAERISRGEAAGHHTTYRVGYRVGSALRLASQARANGGCGHGPRPVPHVRRAHWHMHWVGKVGSDERRLALRWHAPTLVNAASPDDIVPTVRKVDGATRPSAKIYEPPREEYSKAEPSTVRQPLGAGAANDSDERENSAMT